MDVYDFDGTIYRGDSSVDFYLFALKRHPRLVVMMPVQFAAAVLTLLHLVSKEYGKSLFFSFLKWVDADPALVRLFWKTHIDKITPWYMRQKKNSDVIISASPQFLLAPLTELLGIRAVIATPVDPKNGRLQERNCRGREKQRRFNEAFADERIDNFYGDSLADSHLAALSERIWLAGHHKPSLHSLNSFKKHLYINKFCTILSATIAAASIFLYFFIACRVIPAPAGEAEHYLCGMTTLLEHGAISYTRRDIQKAAETFSHFRDRILTKDNFVVYEYNNKTFLHRAATRTALEQDFVGRSYYWGTYSAFCIPFYLILRAIGPEAVNYTGQIANAFLLAVAMLSLLCVLKASPATRLLIVMLVAASPIYPYIMWASAEVFLFSTVTVALVCLVNGYYKTSAFVTGAAASLNYTLAPMGAAIILFYWLEADRKMRDSMQRAPTWSARCKNILPETCRIGGWFFLVYWAALWTYLQFGSIATMHGLGTLTGVLGRFMAYCFDLNFGLIVYYNLIFLIFLIAIPISSYKRKWNILILSAAFLATVFAFSVMSHINGGMSGIARYSAWSAPIMLFCVVLFYESLCRQKSRMIIWGVLLGGAILSVAGTLLSYDNIYVQHTAIARTILKYCPELYLSLQSTFISRTMNVDGGYKYSKPVIFYSGGQARKMLVSKNDLDTLIPVNAESEKFMAKLKKHPVKSPDAPFFVNIRGAVNFFPEAKKALSSGQKIHFAEWADSVVFSSGFNLGEAWGRWSDGDESTLIFKLSRNSPKTVRLGFTVLAFPTLKHADILLNGVKIAHWSFAPSLAGVERTLEFPTPKNPYIRLTFRYDKPGRPRDMVKNSSDGRILALGFVSMRCGD